MKYLIPAVLAVSFMAAPLAAQKIGTTQDAVVGTTGDDVYSVRVAGTNGQIYACRPNTEVLNGQTVRRCRILGVGAGLAGGALLGGSLTAGAAAGLVGASALVLVAASGGGGGSSTTTTTAASN